MGFVGTFLGIVGFSIGLPIGLLLGFFLFVYSKPGEDAKEPEITPLHELDTLGVLDILPEIPNWVKNPDYERVDWLNKYVYYMWPYLDKAICNIIRSTTKPIFAEYVGQYQINSIKFEKLSLGTLPPVFHGMKVYETNENQLVMEPAIKWAGNPNIALVVSLMSVQIKIQLVDLQISANPRIHLKPLVPTFPCFAGITVSLMEKPYVDFGLKIMGGDIMSIPGVYRFVQETIKKQVASLYHWPQYLEIPVLDSSTAALKSPVGILHVNVIRAKKLLKKDIVGTSDPYVKLRLSGERLSAKKTTIKKRNLNPEWNEKFNLIVKDPETQVLELQVYDWDKIGGHDKLGMQVIPLKQLTPHEPRTFTLDLLKCLNINDPDNKKPRGELVVELTFDPFKNESESSNGSGELRRRQSSIDREIVDASLCESGVLVITVIQARDLEDGERRINSYAQVLFRGGKRKTMTIKNNRSPRWNEEFAFMAEESPLDNKLHIEVFNKHKTFGFLRKNSLGFVDISLTDVVRNGRINEKYHLINSKHGMIHVEIQWQTT